MVTPVAMEPMLGYHPCSIGFLTSDHELVGGQCQVGSLTGAVASERVSAVSYTHLDVYKRQQLGEHLPCKQGVKGSNPSISIRMQKHRILLCTLKTAYRKYKISLTQKIQDIREKTKNVCEHKRT